MHFIEGVGRDQEVSFVLDELIAEDHYVRLIELLSEQFFQENKELFVAKGLKAVGRKSYSPAMLLGLLLYGYLNGINSSRKLEQESQRNLELRWLCRCLAPDHKTIADYRKDHAEVIPLFTRSFNRMLKQQGYIQGHTLSIDGSKLRASASKSYSVKSIASKLDRLRQKSESYLQALDMTDQQDDETEELKQRKAELLLELESLAKQKQKLSLLQEKLEEKPAKRISPTDPDARVMKSRQGRHYSYNLQAITDSSFDMVAGFWLSNQENDKGLLTEGVEEAEKSTGAKAEEVLADAGYYDTAQILELESRNVCCYVAVNHNQQKTLADVHGIYFTYEAEKDRYRCSEGKLLEKRSGIKRDNRRGTSMQRYVATACQNCAKKSLCTRAEFRSVYRHHNQEWRDSYQVKMESEGGKRKLVQRAASIEHVFGTIKQRMSFHHLLLRGIRKAEAEASLYVYGYNFTRLLNLASFQSIKNQINSFRWKVIYLIILPLFRSWSKKSDMKKFLSQI